MPQRKNDEPFLSRWSRRKLEAARAEEEVREPMPPPPPVPPTPEAAVAAPAPSPQAAAAEPPLPPVEALTFDSDFRVFMKPGVDPDVQRAALRKLLHDPRFNVMDGLDVYIDDYTKASPLAADVVAKLAHARYLFSPPRTRVNADGVVEDVPEAEAAQAQETQAEPVAIAASEPSSSPSPRPAGTPLPASGETGWDEGPSEEAGS